MKTIVGITNELNSNQLSQLDSFVSLYNKISHKLYVDLFIKKLPIKELCPLYQTKYSINKRHFDSIRKTLEGKVSSILSLNKNYIIDTKDKIKTIEKDLSKQTKTYNSYKDKYIKNGKLIWKFNKKGILSFGCLQPGHLEAGMKGEITVK